MNNLIDFGPDWKFVIAREEIKEVLHVKADSLYSDGRAWTVTLWYVGCSSEKDGRTWVTSKYLSSKDAADQCMTDLLALLQTHGIAVPACGIPVGVVVPVVEPALSPCVMVGASVAVPDYFFGIIETADVIVPEIHEEEEVEEISQVLPSDLFVEPQWYAFQIHDSHEGITLAVHKDAASLFVELGVTLNNIKLSGAVIQSIVTGMVRAETKEEALDAVRSDDWLAGTHSFANGGDTDYID